MRPIEVVQPEGAELHGRGQRGARGRAGRFRVGFNAREGLVLHQLGLRRRRRRAPDPAPRVVLARWPCPTAIPSPSRYIQGPFDFGENLVGTLANALELGCDCLGRDPLLRRRRVPTPRASRSTLPQRRSACTRRTSACSGSTGTSATDETEVRRSRRLVVSSITTIGNYDYGFFWYLYQDGTIESRGQADRHHLDRRVRTRASSPRHGTLLAEGLYAMHHQHFFNVRLDFDLDGEHNAVYEVHTEPTPPGPTIPYGNAFRRRATLLRDREPRRRQLIDPLAARSWLVVNHERHQRDGRAGRLSPGAGRQRACPSRSRTPRRASAPASATSTSGSRSYDAERALRRRRLPQPAPRRRRACRSTSPHDRPIADEDIVLWYTFGHTTSPARGLADHAGRHESASCSSPSGFFDRNPTLDVPPPRSSHSCCHGNGDGA